MNTDCHGSETRSAFSESVSPAHLRGSHSCKSAEPTSAAQNQTAPAKAIALGENSNTTELPRSLRAVWPDESQEKRRLWPALTIQRPKRCRELTQIEAGSQPGGHRVFVRHAAGLANAAHSGHSITHPSPFFARSSPNPPRSRIANPARIMLCNYFQNSAPISAFLQSPTGRSALAALSPLVPEPSVYNSHVLTIRWIVYASQTGRTLCRCRNGSCRFR